MPLVAVVIDPPFTLAIDQRGERCVLHLSRVGLGYIDAKGFPNFAQFGARAGEKGPTVQVRFESAGVVFQNRGAVALRVCRDREQEVVIDFLLNERPLYTGEMGREKWTDVGAGCKDERDQDYLASRARELKRLAVLIGELEIGHRGVDDAPADLRGFFGRQRNVRETGHG